MHNKRLDVCRLLDDLDLAPVAELHVAGGVRQNGFQVDVHSRVVHDSTMAIALEIMSRAPALKAVTFEYLKEAVRLLGHDAICSQVSRLRSILLQ